MIINFKKEDGYEIIINMSNVLYINRRFDEGYRIVFKDGPEINLTWKEYDRLTKAISEHGAE